LFINQNIDLETHKNNDEEDKIQKMRKNCMESLKNAKSRQ
jgi:hypothetical protein